MSKCVNCLKEINEKEVFCLTCHEEVLGCAKNQIADLEAKLVESEKKASKKNDESWDLYLSLKQFYSRLGVEAYADDEIQDVAVKELNRLLNENEQLKQQLAEKELKKIKNLRATPKQLQRAYQERYKYKERYNELKNQHLKDKISFTIEQLEKVKSAFGLINSKLDKVETIKEYIHYIDHQIKELKGEKK